MCDDCFFFYFKLKTAYDMRISDWSSDLCSSDLGLLVHQIYAVWRGADPSRSAAPVHQCVPGPIHPGLWNDGNHRRYRHAAAKGSRSRRKSADAIGGERKSVV